MSKKIHSMFSDIHNDYDRMNHVFSMGIDILWRKAAADEALLEKNPYRILDMACGTGDSTIQLYKTAARNGKDVEVVGLDFNEDMLKVAKEKVKGKGIHGISFELGDVLSTKFESGSFDVIASAFAIRDFDDAGKFVEESKRLLKDGGKVVFLDMAMPDDAFRRAFFRQYFKFLKAVGSTVNKGAYNFLFDSIMEFDKKGLVATIKKKGFSNVRVRNLQSGIGFVVSGEKRRP